MIDYALKAISKRYLSDEPRSNTSDWWQADAKMVAVAAGYLKCIIGESDERREHVMAWLTSLSGAGIGEPVGIRRAVSSLFSSSKHDMETIFEKSLRQFGEQLYIRHAPTLHQEGKRIIASSSLA